MSGRKWLLVELVKVVKSVESVEAGGLVVWFIVYRVSCIV